MKPWRRRLAKLGALLAGVTLLWACNAPSIPVPPPGVTEVAFAAQQIIDDDGGSRMVWIATQSRPLAAAASARFYLFDITRGSGIIQMANVDGTFVSGPLEGDAGDRISISYETPEGDLSSSVCMLLVEGATAPRCPE